MKTIEGGRNMEMEPGYGDPVIPTENFYPYKNYLKPGFRRNIRLRFKKFYKCIAYGVGETNYQIAKKQIKWISENCYGRYYFQEGGPNSFWNFERKDDLLAFKLNWCQ